MVRRIVSCLAAGIALSMAVVGPGVGTASATIATRSACARTRVLLLGSYPAEVSANLAREHLDRHQPRTLAGHEFYAGRLEGRRVILAIAGPSPAITYGTTALALKHFRCISAVVFSGTAGGGGRSGLGDVTVASRWTSNGGRTFHRVGAKPLSVARRIAAAATSRLGTMAAVNDGPCACSGTVNSLKLVAILRTPKVIVGGKATTYGGGGDTCSAQGGELAGCNPCPTGTGPKLVPSTVTAGATTSDAAARRAARAAKAGVLVRDPTRVLARFSPSAPDDGSTTAGTDYIADDQQTTAAMAAARRYGVPFIAFRGISDTSAVGDLWPFEYLVYQQLAADNAALAARLWIKRWR